MNPGSALLLVGAIVCEVAATLSLKATDGFRVMWPLSIVIVGYAGAFVFLGLSLRHLTVGVAYAIWSAAGTVLVTAAAALIFRQQITLLTTAGMALTVIGIVLINLSEAQTV